MDPNHLGNFLGGPIDCITLIFVSQGNTAFLEAAAKELPTKTFEEIQQHEEWYTEYSTLLQTKRRAIDAWREEKEVRSVLVVAQTQSVPCPH